MWQSRERQQALERYSRESARRNFIYAAKMITLGLSYYLVGKPIDLLFHNKTLTKSVDVILIIAALAVTVDNLVQEQFAEERAAALSAEHITLPPRWLSLMNRGLLPPPWSAQDLRLAYAPAA